MSHRFVLPLLWILSGTAVPQAQEASGAFAPEGPPVQGPVRVDAGGACIVDLVQGYRITGALEGELELDYRIFVDGPCGSPVGTYDEEWIAHGTFQGTAWGDAATATLWYRAHVAAGGVVEGRMNLAGTVAGEVAVSGRFSEGRLSYQGDLES